MRCECQQAAEPAARARVAGASAVREAATAVRSIVGVHRSSRVAGLLLAAGAGSRFGGPKALTRSPDGTPWLVERVAALAAGGCEPVLVALGAAADRACELLPAGAAPVIVKHWEQGLSVSLRVGLQAVLALRPAPDAALIALVDIPGLNSAAVRRVREQVVEGGARALAQASYQGVPGHPVLLGRQHWSRVADAATGDRGGGPYLRQAGALLVECADVADGTDVDVRTSNGERLSRQHRGSPC